MAAGFTYECILMPNALSKKFAKNRQRKNVEFMPLVTAIKPTNSETTGDIQESKEDLRNVQKLLAPPAAKVMISGEKEQSQVSEEKIVDLTEPLTPTKIVSELKLSSGPSNRQNRFSVGSVPHVILSPMPMPTNIVSSSPNVVLPPPTPSSPQSPDSLVGSYPNLNAEPSTPTSINVGRRFTVTRTDSCCTEHEDRLHHWISTQLATSAVNVACDEFDE